MNLYLFPLLLTAVTAATELDDLIRSIFYGQNGGNNNRDSVKKIIQATNKYQNNHFPGNNGLNGIQQFSVDFYKQITSNNSENIIISPLSANIALSMLATGAAGNTKSEMLQILHLPANDQSIKTSYQSLISSLNNIKGVTLKVLNKIFISNSFQLKQSFKDALSTSFQSEEQQLNFADPKTAANSINSWVSKESNNKIKDIVEADSLTEATAMFVANVVYFKGEWLYKFSEISEKMFFTNYQDRGNSLVPTMHQQAEFVFGHVPNVPAKFIEMPYKSEDLVMLIVLPDDVHGLEEVEKSLETLSLVTLRRAGFLASVDLFLPKFKVENTIVLNEILQKMGMKEMFTDSANFSEISAGSGLRVNKVTQKTFIEVNEDGAEAAGVTGSEIGFRFGHKDPTIFNVDHPFHYKIIKTKGDNEGIVLFAGNCKYIAKPTA